jgi:hypothetical protein
VESIEANVAHQQFDPCLARRESSCPQFSHHARTAVSPSEFYMNGPDKCQHLAGGQLLAIRSATKLLRPLATDADVVNFIHFGQCKRLALRGNPGVLHRTSLAN